MSVREDLSRSALAPSVLSADFGDLRQEIKKIEQAGADFIHVDVMDGHFVPNITIGPMVVRSISEYSRIPMDVHLMIEKPERYVEAFIDAGAKIVSVHVESCPHLHRVLQQIRKHGGSPSVVLNPHTPVSSVEYILEDVDMVLIMSVNPGFGGQEFIPGTFQKIEKMANLVESKGLDVDIEVDGGIKPENCGPVVSAGATVLVAGTAVFHSVDYYSAIEKMKIKIP